MLKHHVVAVAAGIALTLSACSSASGSAAHADKTVVVATHDSWAAPKALIQQFEKQTGYTVKIVENGDAGELTNKLVLTKSDPIADAVYGIDNTFAGRAVSAGVLAPYRTSSVPVGQYDTSDGSKYLTPIDWADVCVDIDDAWFAKHDVPKPTSLDDLIKPQYKNLFVTAGASTSSPGFAFLLTTIAAYGNGWQNYWKQLMANGAKITDGWDEAFDVDYTDGGGKGDRPIVLSYNSDPVDTIPSGSSTPQTSTLLNTCFRDVEYAGVLAGAKNPAGAKAWVEFLTGVPFQESMPDNMYVFPVNPQAKLPALWTTWAKPAPHPYSVPTNEIDANRTSWLNEWTDLTSG